MAVRVQTATPVARSRRWLKRNLFSNTANTVLTLVTITVTGFALFSIGRFVLISADWESVEVNRRLLAVATYPRAEEWRLWPPLWLLGGAIGLGYGLWSHFARREMVVALIAAFVVFGAGPLVDLSLIPIFEGANAVRAAAVVLLAIGGYVLGRYILLDSEYESLGRRVAVIGGILVLPLAVVLLNYGDEVETSDWGGVMLNLMLASVGIGIGFPAGVLLALGRASSLPVIRIACTSYIEFVRAGPLILWLAVARLVLPDFLPGVFGLDELDLVVRAILVIGGFAAAYIAEVVRGGLQAVPSGQREAADALGLNTFQTTTFIVLPQALRVVIPALVNRFVSLWKDTSLVVVLSFVDLLGAARRIPAQPEFIGTQAESLLFVALVFWAIAFAMSRLSARVERQLGVGVR
jgi:general L-amino acid transport system permease protein